MKLISHYEKRLIPPQNGVKDWDNHTVTDALIYSYRDTVYSADTFPSFLHYHDYYELTVIEEGDVRYVCGSQVYTPSAGDLLLIPPGEFHMSVLNGATTRYRRHVFYFYPNALSALGFDGLLPFADTRAAERLLSFSADAQREDALGLLHRLHGALSKQEDPAERALAFGCLLEFFYLLNKRVGKPQERACALPENILKLKSYVDRHYATLTSTAELAQHFFYSREHVSRLFKQHFDITVSDYILQRRILESRRLLLEGVSISDAAYSVGFNSMSAFIRAFRAVLGTTPSEYRKQNR